MDGQTTIKYLQSYICEKDCKPELLMHYFPKLTEEVGEPACAMRKDAKAALAEEKYPSGVRFEQGR